MYLKQHVVTYALLALLTTGWLTSSANKPGIVSPYQYPLMGSNIANNIKYINISVVKLAIFTRSFMRME